MKNLLFVIVFISMGTGFAIAQSRGFAFGPKVGVNATKIAGQSFQDQFEWGYQLGGFVRIPFSKRLAIQPEVLYNQTNTKTASNISDVYPNGQNLKDVKLNYLAIPVLLNYNVSRGLTLQAGPQFGILTGSDSFLQTAEQAFKKGDLSMLGGLTLHLGSLQIYGRYGIGLSNINDIDNQDSWRNQSIQVGIGYAF